MTDGFAVDPENDKRLAARVLRGERGAVEEFYLRFAPVIDAVARRFPREMRGDLIQDTWSKLLSRNFAVLRQWRATTPAAPLQRYLHTVALNAMRDAFRRRELLVPTDPAQLPEPEVVETDPFEDASRIEALELCAETAQSRLSEHQQILLRLRYAEALRHREIAERVGRAPRDIGTLLARAERNLLEEMLESCRDLIDEFGLTPVPPNRPVLGGAHA